MVKVSKPLAAVVGQNILAKRKFYGLTQDELAEKVGIGQQSLSRMEKGYIAPRFDRLESLAEALNCSVPELFRNPDAEQNAGNDELLSVAIDTIKSLSPAAREAFLPALTALAHSFRKLEQKK